MIQIESIIGLQYWLQIFHVYSIVNIFVILAILKHQSLLSANKKNPK